MSILQIDTDSTLAYFDELVQLESLEYLLEFVWSARESCWYLNLLDQDSNQIAMGINLLLNVSLFRRFKDPRVPPGRLLCLDVSGTNTDIQAIGELGTRVLLLYVTSDDSSLTV